MPSSIAQRPEHRSPVERRSRRRARLRRVTWSADRRLAVLLLAVATGTNVPTPLLLVYRERLAMTDASLTAIFGVYALGLMLALAVAGRAADRFGRRRVVLPAAVCAAARLAAVRPRRRQRAPPLPRPVPPGGGLGDGVQRRQRLAGGDGRPPREPRRPRTAAVAMTGGFAVGPVFAGLIGEWGPWPLVLPYLMHVAVLLLALWPPGRWRSRWSGSGGTRHRAAWRVPSRRPADRPARRRAARGLRLRLPGEHGRRSPGPGRVPRRAGRADRADGRSRPRRGRAGGPAPGSARAAYRARRGRLRGRRLRGYGARGRRPRACSCSSSRPRGCSGPAAGSRWPAGCRGCPRWPARDGWAPSRPASTPPPTSGSASR